MFDIGFSELVLISLVALIVLGPKRLPEAARAAGRWVERARRFIAEVKQDFDSELHHEELAELRKLKHELEETQLAMQDTTGKLFQELTDEASIASPTIHSGEPETRHDSAALAVPPPQPAVDSQRTAVKAAKKSRPRKKHDAAGSR